MAYQVIARVHSKMAITPNDGDPSANVFQHLILPTAADCKEIGYDPHKFGNTDRRTAFWSVVMHLIAMSAGPAILSVPIAFAEIGYGLGVLGALICTCLYAHSMDTLLRSEYEVCQSKRIPSLTYPELLHFAFEDGPANLKWFANYSRHIINIIFIVFWMSACCYNLILSSENVQIVYNLWVGESVDIQPVMSWLIIPLLFLCSVPTFRYLAPVSIVSSVANSLCICLIVYDVIFGQQPFEGLPSVGSITQLPIFLGSILFAMNATGLMLPLKKEMREPARFNSPLGVLTFTYIPVFFMYTLFGLLCALKYGANTKESVILNTSSAAGSIIRCCIILANTLALILQYPLMAYVIFDVVWNSFVRKGELMKVNPTVQEYAIRAAITAVVFSLTYSLPNAELYVTIGGAFGTVTDSLLLPACVQTLVMWRVRKTRKGFGLCACKNIAISSLAVALMVLGGVTCVQKMLLQFSNK